MTVASNRFPMAVESPHVRPADKSQPLNVSVREALQNYFAQLKGEEPLDLYQAVLAEVDVPLLKVTLSYCKGNQSKVATLLGLSRGTVRKMLKIYGMID